MLDDRSGARWGVLVLLYLMCFSGVSVTVLDSIRRLLASLSSSADEAKLDFTLLPSFGKLLTMPKAPNSSCFLTVPLALCTWTEGALPNPIELRWAGAEDVFPLHILKA
mmetsp:Transcript_128584/g.274253  ORF Transcript_128584/g.274253 Transcript_128584/m.274253 type:complete len:109 (-) Transcript_128584:314-640(-)